jgi:peptidoglycan/xylan/chitin deacetylase (PgdA/CDA1 family)
MINDRSAFNRFRRIGKKIAFHSGLLGISRRLNPRKSPVILGYHTIETPEFLRRVLGIGFSAKEFQRQIEYLAKNQTVISMTDFLQWFSENRPLPDNSVMITFDDGYRDVYEIAKPILERRGLPATVFVTTGVIDTGKSIWTNRLHSMIDRSKRKEVRLLLPGYQEQIYRFDAAASSRESALTLAGRMKKMSPSVREESLRNLASVLEVDTEYDPIELLPMLTWKQIGELAGAGFTIGSHTVTHPILAHCDEKELHYELEASRLAIESHAGIKCEVLAYPNGQIGDYDKETASAARAAGYCAGFAFHGGVPDRTRDPFGIPRLPLLDVPLSEFAAALM